MAEFSKFRSSVGGFHRADVTTYIETLCESHRTALEQMQKDNENLSRRLAQAELELEQCHQQEVLLRNELSQAQAAQETTQTALEEALTMAAELDSRLTEVLAEQASANGPEPSTTEEAPQPDYTAMELEAYRRAEATERLASQRAAAMRQQLSDLLAGLSARYAQAGQEIRALSDDVRTNLQRLQETLLDLDAVFDDTDNRFETLQDDVYGDENL